MRSGQRALQPVRSSTIAPAGTGPWRASQALHVGRGQPVVGVGRGLRADVDHHRRRDQLLERHGFGAPPVRREVDGRVEVRAAVLGRAERVGRVEEAARGRPLVDFLQLEARGGGRPVEGRRVERVGQVHEPEAPEVDRRRRRKGPPPRRTPPPERREQHPAMPKVIAPASVSGGVDRGGDRGQRVRDVAHLGEAAGPGPSRGSAGSRPRDRAGSAGSRCAAAGAASGCGAITIAITVSPVKGSLPVKVSKSTTPSE